VQIIELPIAGILRSYHLTGDLSGVVRPTVVFLHGTGATPVIAATETSLPAFARKHGFQLAIPAGLPPDPSRPPAFLSNPPRFNDGSTTAEDPHHTTTDDIIFLDAVLDDLIRNHHADPRRIFLTGFSNGAGMTFRYAAERRSRLAAIAPVAGHCWIDPAPVAPPIPTLLIHGELDPLIPLNGGPVKLPWGLRLVNRPPVDWTIEKWIAANGLDELKMSPVESGDGYRIRTVPADTGQVVLQCVVAVGLGHHWPGGMGQLNPRIGGPKSTTLHANDLIWQFFVSTARS
jgi:polyhydroxybutyrate depolymerase